MQGRKTALLKWLANTTQKQITDIKEIIDCTYIIDVISRIPCINIQNKQNIEGWKNNYLKMKQIYTQLDIYLKEVIKVPFPDGLSTLNMIQMAKGQDQDGLISLLHLVFIVCIQSSEKERFINSIIQLSASNQQELMKIIQQNVKEAEQETQEQKSRKKIDELYYTIENLCVENDSLRETLLQEEQNQKKNEENLKKLQKQNEKLRKDLLQKIQMLRAKEEQSSDREFDHSEQIVEELKKTLLDQERQYNLQITQLKDKIYYLTDQLEVVKAKNQQLQDKRLIGHATVDHTNCINIQLHKKILGEYGAKNKELSQNQFKYKLENVKLTNIINELQGQIRKLNEQSQKNQNQFKVTQKEGNELKLEVFKRLRDDLKKKITDMKDRDQKSKQNKIQEFLQIDNKNQ